MRSSVTFLAILLVVVYCSANAQRSKVTGVVYDSLSLRPVAGATVILGNGEVEMTDERGVFAFRKTQLASYLFSVSAIGYQKKHLLIDTLNSDLVIKLLPARTTLANVTVTGISRNPYKILSEADIGMRRVANSQEILRMVPGLFIGQHQGGGKAEQIFLRGFDEDHGKDIQIAVDGIPINMLSHAHSQGYADSHFVIPETIERVVFNKGPYDAEKGNHATSGYLEFFTTNTLSRNTIKVEAGQFNTYRLLGMMKILNEKSEEKGNSWYAASEYSYSDGFFQLPQHFKRFNFFTKLNYVLSSATKLMVSASAFQSSWRASGQIPERAVSSGILNYYGALDSNEGGRTARYNVNVLLRTVLGNGGMLKNQVYYSRYSFDLNSNFTFFLQDSINGDEIRQSEKRHLLGYNGNYLRKGYVKGWNTTFQLGLDIRTDFIDNSELSHTRQRVELVNRIKLGDINEFGFGIYTDLSLQLNKKWLIKTGFRVDRFYYKYNNEFAGDTAFQGVGIYKARNQVVSPKVNIHYSASSYAQFYLSIGKGFHTNDTRLMVVQKGNSTLPAAYGIDVGGLYKPMKHLLIHTALWFIYLQREYVYAGDGGTIDFSGRTRRMGFDLSIRYQPVTFILVDADLNYAHGRAIDESKDNNFIPLAPVWSSNAGIKMMSKNGWSASIRYRYLSKRPANQDYSLVCQPYFINDFICGYKNPRFEYGLVINNLFDVRWKETQFEALTRLRNEPLAVDDITFTAGTKLSAKLIFSYFFGVGYQKPRRNAVKI